MYANYALGALYPHILQPYVFPDGMTEVVLQINWDYVLLPCCDKNKKLPCPSHGKCSSHKLADLTCAASFK